MNLQRTVQSTRIAALLWGIAPRGSTIVANALRPYLLKPMPIEGIPDAIRWFCRTSVLDRSIDGRRSAVRNPQRAPIPQH